MVGICYPGSAALMDVHEMQGGQKCWIVMYGGLSPAMFSRRASVLPVPVPHHGTAMLEGHHPVKHQHLCTMWESTSASQAKGQKTARNFQCKQSILFVMVLSWKKSLAVLARVCMYFCHLLLCPKGLKRIVFNLQGDNLYGNL